MSWLMILKFIRHCPYQVWKSNFGLFYHFIRCQESIIKNCNIGIPDNTPSVWIIAKVSTPFACTKEMDLHPEKYTDSGMVTIISIVFEIYQGWFKRHRKLDDAIDSDRTEAAAFSAVAPVARSSKSYSGGDRQGTSSQYQYCYLDLVIWYYLSAQLIQYK